MAADIWLWFMVIGSGFKAHAEPQRRRVLVLHGLCAFAALRELFVEQFILVCVLFLALLSDN